MDNRDKGAERKSVVPACSISEQEGIVTVKLEMPGVTKEGLEVRVDGNTLSAEGTRSPEELRGVYYLRERRAGRYRKTFTIDETIDRDKVEAELTDGILTLRLRVKEAAKPRRISVA